MRLYDEEIKSAVEYERETMGGNQGSKDGKEEEEFTFENSRSLKKPDPTKGKPGKNGIEADKKAMTNEQDVRALQF